MLSAVVRSTWSLFTSFEANVVVDLLPIPFRRALNFRLVAFMVISGESFSEGISGFEAGAV